MKQTNQLRGESQHYQQKDNKSANLTALARERTTIP